MKLRLSIEYITRWGEHVRVILSLTDVRGRTIAQTHTLGTRDGKKWAAEIMIGNSSVRYFSYYYCIFNDKTLVRKEWDFVPRRMRADITKTFVMQDIWRETPLYAHLYTSAFTKCLRPHEAQGGELPYFNSTVMLRVAAPQLLPGQALAVLGNQPALGEWNTLFAFPMKETELHQWCVTFSAAGISFPMEYKYVITDAKTGAFVAWEEGENRMLPADTVARNEVLVVSDELLRVPGTHWKAAGVVIPVFSLRSEGSQGVGDFGDLKSMVDWATLTNMHVIQILPVYDTTIHNNWLDSYPYNSISIYALHPQYIDLRQLPPLSNSEKMKSYEAERARINALPEVDYEAVSRLKQDYLHAAFDQEGNRVLASPDYADFFRRNEHWLMPYAAFCVLRNLFGTADFRYWPSYAKYNADRVRSLCKPGTEYYPRIAYYYYIQYQLHRQLSAATAYAREHKVILKGDIPIGISRNSVEAWTEPYYFNCDVSSGAPPDNFSLNGQNWGFPTYNWDVMLKDGCKWWKRRFRKMAEYFDAYRIDHVLGFFRIWEIPANAVHGLLGRFNPALPLSVEEIERVGLHFKKEYTQPHITERILDELFGDDKDKVKAQFLYRPTKNRYALKPKFDTQKKVQAYFLGKTSPVDIALRDNLYALISDVLFIPDPQLPDRYHPRICAQLACAYRDLTAVEQRAFDVLYDDFFFRRHNEFWYEQAMRKLPLLVESTPMLVCAEDLGMVPECVGWLMRDLRILTLEIQTMPKQSGVRFAKLEENPYRSVATIYTHDMPTLRLWWEEDSKRTQRFFSEILQKDGDAPTSIPAWLCEEVVARHLYSPSMLCLISWQDWLSIDENLRRADIAAERINVPSDSRHYWRYRMHIPIEKLMLCDELNEKIRLLIAHSERD